MAEVAGGGEEGLHTGEDHQDRKRERRREKGRGGSAQQGEGAREGPTKGWMQTEERDRDRQRQSETDAEREGKRRRETEAAAETMADAGKRTQGSRSHFGA